MESWKMDLELLPKKFEPFLFSDQLCWINESASFLEELKNLKGELVFAFPIFVGHLDNLKGYLFGWFKPGKPAPEDFHYIRLVLEPSLTQRFLLELVAGRNRLVVGGPKHLLYGHFYPAEIPGSKPKIFRTIGQLPDTWYSSAVPSLSDNINFAEDTARAFIKDNLQATGANTNSGTPRPAVPKGKGNEMTLTDGIRERGKIRRSRLTKGEKS